MTDGRRAFGAKAGVVSARQGNIAAATKKATKRRGRKIATSASIRRMEQNATLQKVIKTLRREALDDKRYLEETVAGYMGIIADCMDALAQHGTYIYLDS